MNILNKLIKDKYIFLKLYLIVSCVFLIYKIIMCFIDDDILMEILRINFTNIIFGSITYIKFYMIATFEAVPFAFLLIIHFGVIFEGMVAETIGYNKLVYMIIVPIIGVVLYVFFRLICKAMMPFSLLEGLFFATILYVIKTIIYRIKARKIRNA